MKSFPIHLNVRGARALVVGQGAAADAKARLLATAGASVAREQSLAAPDFSGARLAVIAVEDAGAAARLADAARAAGALVNVVDQPALCDFIIPSIVDRGDVVVSISTNGAAPVLARNIRRLIEPLLPARLGALAAFARARRPAVAGRIAPPARRAFWERIFSGPVATRFLAGDARGAAAAFDAALDAGAAGGAGVVHIVGAGPGDPELLTLRALRLIQDADVILYDRLVGDAILGLARRDAERIYVGKAKANHSLPQEEIGAALVAHARAGRMVVRLKGGDPFIFGRGGEELEAVRAAGVDVYVTPGITAATGCAASAALPLTHRDYAHAVTFVTGHERADGKNKGEPPVDWKSLAASGHTLVIYMGVGAAGEIAAKLVAAGRAAETPVAVIENGTRPEERILAGELGDLGEIVRSGAVKGPALLVIGDVAAFAAASDLGALAIAEERIAA